MGDREPAQTQPSRLYRMLPTPLDRRLAAGALALGLLAIPFGVKLHRIGENPPPLPPPYTGEVPEVTIPLSPDQLYSPAWYFDLPVTQNPLNPSEVVYTSEVKPEQAACSWQDMSIFPEREQVDRHDPRTGYTANEGYVLLTREARITPMHNETSSLEVRVLSEAEASEGFSRVVAGEPYSVRIGDEFIPQTFVLFHDETETTVSLYRVFTNVDGKPSTPSGDPLNNDGHRYYVPAAFCGNLILP